jgi:hypothetical protein
MQLLRDALLLSLRRGAGPFRSFGQLAFEPRAHQLVPLLMALRQDPVRLAPLLLHQESSESGDRVPREPAAPIARGGFRGTGAPPSIAPFAFAFPAAALRVGFRIDGGVEARLRAPAKVGPFPVALAAAVVAVLDFAFGAVFAAVFDFAFDFVAGFDCVAAADFAFVGAFASVFAFASAFPSVLAFAAPSAFPAPSASPSAFAPPPAFAAGAFFPAAFAAASSAACRFRSSTTSSRKRIMRLRCVFGVALHFSVSARWWAILNLRPDSEVV